MADHEVELTRLCQQAINEVTTADMQKFKVLPESKIRPRVAAGIMDSLKRAVAHHRFYEPAADERMRKVLAENHLANLAQFFRLARVSQELANQIAQKIVEAEPRG